jgi:hypothetical protein
MQPISPMMSEYILGNIIDQFPDLHRHVESLAAVFCEIRMTLPEKALGGRPE